MEPQAKDRLVLLDAGGGEEQCLRGPLEDHGPVDTLSSTSDLQHSEVRTLLLCSAS